jgi:hypothetical protein
MMEYMKDAERTRAARRAKVLVDHRSYYSIGGHVYLRGADRSNLRDRVFCDNEARGGQCDICQKKLQLGQGDLEHIAGGRPKMRCDCYHQVLSDGTVHTNVRRSCEMRESGSCHQRKHNRLVKWRNS